MAILSENINGKIINVEILSTNISKASYDTQTKVLTITFNNGFIYEYEDVSWELFTKLRMSESQGKFFNEFISKKHTFRKIN